MKKSIIAGIVGTIIMTIVMYVAPFMGIPKMSPPEMLAGMMNLPVFLGWAMHFMIGVAFALAYTHLFAPKAKFNNIYLKGAAFGLAAFVFAQIAMGILGEIFPMPPMEGSLMLMMLGSIMGHAIFGMAVAKTVGF
ncbi:MAG: hypothetical protein HY842_12525 [Bacteroidetes bacterium]|nr:hypothetical protein [Bacteroidota bacterium]